MCIRDRIKATEKDNSPEKLIEEQKKDDKAAKESMNISSDEDQFCDETIHLSKCQIP